MSSAMKTAESNPSGLELYRVRDELAQAYNPANAVERMLVAQMAQSWIRLQRAQDAETQYFTSKTVLEAITNDFEKYKAITRYVSDCERAWRHAMLQLEKTQRLRSKTDTRSPNARKRWDRPPASTALPAEPAEVSVAPATSG
jgi:hypothetical protein